MVRTYRTYTYTTRPGALALVCARLRTLAFRRTGGCIVDGKHICDLSLQRFTRVYQLILHLREYVH